MIERIAPAREALQLITLELEENAAMLAYDHHTNTYYIPKDPQRRTFNSPREASSALTRLGVEQEIAAFLRKHGMRQVADAIERGEYRP